jgi:3'-phosphoadenosine 5'-phosphosulfate (PAPS) 3'-phosphatase
MLAAVIEAAVAAGQEILDVYESDFAVEQKADRSPSPRRTGAATR